MGSPIEGRNVDMFARLGHTLAASSQWRLDMMPALNPGRSLFFAWSRAGIAVSLAPPIGHVAHKITVSH